MAKEGPEPASHPPFRGAGWAVSGQVLLVTNRSAGGELREKGAIKSARRAQVGVIYNRVLPLTRGLTGCSFRWVPRPLRRVQVHIGAQ